MEPCSPKRSSDDIDVYEQPQKKKTKLSGTMFSGGKNPVQLLHEKFQTVEYDFQHEGLAHEPKFTVSAVLNGEKFNGKGLSKQKAKVKLAVVALRKLGYGNILGEELDENGKILSEPISQIKSETISPLKDPVWTFQPFSPEKRPDSNFSSESDVSWDLQMPGRDRDERLLYAPPSSRNSGLHPWGSRYSPSSNCGRSPQRPGVAHIMGPMSPPQAVAHKFSQLFTNRPAINVEKARSFPVMILSEIFPDIKIEWMEGSGRGDRQFKVEAEVQGRRFFGEGRSKKIAKLNLAKTILLCMYDIHDFKDNETAPKSPKTKSDETQLEKKFPLTQLKELVGDDMATEVIQQDELNDQGEKVFLATIVVRGVAYEAIGKHKNLAKLRAAKKALDALRPKKEGSNGGDTSSYCGSDGGTSPTVKEVDTTRHPTMVFYELYRDVKFDCEETKGANGLNEYVVEAMVNDQKFSGKACSKKKAKLRLVLSAFEELRGIPMSEWTSIDLQETMEERTLSSNPAANHPIVLLLKLNPQTRFIVTEDYDCDITAKYKAVAYVGDRQFNGEGANKKSAKTVAARLALQELFGIDADNYIEETRNDIFKDEEPKKEVPIELSNRIADAVQKKFLEVFQGETQCKVIAAFIVANHSESLEEPLLSVVSIGTGTKCITGEMIDHKGQTLNDCHGEIIACRGFRRYLFDELMKALKEDSNTLFERTKDNKFRLKEIYQVYLFVNTAPCGDGRVFTLQTQQQQGAKNKTAGLLRTKIENGQGTIPVPENNIQTSDGILEGERLRTMSCSDKILKWNALGVQGALLSYFIDPVYLEGVVIGLHYNYDALCRALYKRAIKMENCPTKYRLNKPSLGSPNNMENSRDTSKATSNSFNWHTQERTAEAVNATTGKTVVLTPSRLCKLNFFDKFMHSLKLYSPKIDPKTYHCAKSLASDYQKTKELFFKALDETTCGKWIGKPYEHDMFGY